MENDSTVVLKAIQRALVATTAAFCLISGTALWGLWRQGAVLETTVSVVLPRVEALSAIREENGLFQGALARLSGQPGGSVEAARKGVEGLERALEKLGSQDDPDLRPLAEEVRNLRAKFENLRKPDAAPQSAQGSGISGQRVKELNTIAAAIDVRVDGMAQRLQAQSLREGQDALSRARQARLLVYGELLMGLCGALVTSVFILRRLKKPLHELLVFLKSAAQKDLTGTIDGTGKDELGALAGAASRLSATLVGTLKSLVVVARELNDRGEELKQKAARAQTGAADQLARAEAGANKAREVERFLEPLTSLGGKLKREAETAASSIQQILAMTQQVQAEMEGLCVRVEAANSAVQELDEATSRVAAVTSQLGAAAQQVAASAVSIDVGSETLRTGAGEGRLLAEDVAARAAIGRSSMLDALGGMSRIREAVDTAVQRFDRLGVELGRVDRVTQVIDDIAGRTNLLSLNAAIIAAQAGEHGQAFGVVASEIRSLAEKTAASTREIRSIVEGVAVGGREAAEAIGEGVSRVGQGEELVRKTGSLLEAIHSSAEHAAQRLREIDRVAERQASEASRVADEIRQVSQGVMEIVGEIRAEEERTREIGQALSQMAGVARETARASGEQSQGTGYITRAVMEVSQVADQVDGAIEKVGGLLTGLRGDIEGLDLRAREDLDLVAQLAQEGQGLATLAGELRREVGTFRLPENG